MNAIHGHDRQCAPPKYEYEEGYAHRAKSIGNMYYQYDQNGNILAERYGAFPAQEPGEKPEVHDVGNDTYYVEEGWGLREGTVDEEENSSAYRWDERNRMIASSNERFYVEYEYGEDGERTGKFVGSTGGSRQGETLYFNRLWSWRYDGQVMDFTGYESKHIFLGENRIVTKVQRSGDAFIENTERIRQYYYHGDHLGSAQVITDYQGAEYERLEYTPYGELWVNEVPGDSVLEIPYRFTGKERDEETGLYYYGARYLDPRTSRWISTDPAMGEYIPGAPINDEVKKHNQNLPGMGGVFNYVNLHVYHYAGNNPIKLVDPDGKWTFAIGLSGSATAGEGVTGSTGVAIGYSKEQGLSFGVYISAGATVGTPSAGGGVTFSVNKKAEGVSDLDGKSTSVGGSVAVVGVEVSTNRSATGLDPASGVSVTIQTPGAEIHVSETVTITASTSVEKIKQAFRDGANKFENWIIGKIKEGIVF